MVKAEQGIVIPAFNTADVDYERCAQQLRTSVLDFHPGAEITILTNRDLPPTDLSGQALDWFAYRLSPYRQTIKLEADMIMAGPCWHWFELFQHQDVCISTGCRDHLGQVSTARNYRRFLDQNHLPDVYNAIAYWRISRTARDFFTWCRVIFENWSEFRKLVSFSPDEPSTDYVYAMACDVVGRHLTTMPFASYPKIAHLKQHVVQGQQADWTREMVWETDPLRIQTVAQWGAVHYVKKTWTI